MTYSMQRMVSCELQLRRKVIGRKIYILRQRLRNDSCTNSMRLVLQWWVCIWFQHTFSILSGSCAYIACRTRDWILILRTRLLILPNTKWNCWNMCRMNNVPNIDVSLSFNLKVYRATISSSVHWPLDLVNHVMIHMICTAMMKNTYSLKISLKCQVDEAMANDSTSTAMDLPGLGQSKSVPIQSEKLLDRARTNALFFGTWPEPARRTLDQSTRAESAPIRWGLHLCSVIK